MKHVLLLDMAIHTFDAARFLLNADPVSVYCKSWNPEGSWWEHGASAVAVFEMTNGIVYTYRGSWSAEGVSTTWESDWRVIGTQGSATWDGAADFKAQRVARTAGWMSDFLDLEIPAITLPATGHEGVIDDFIRCVREGGTPLSIASENIRSLAMVFAAIQSAETGARVPVVW